MNLALRIDNLRESVMLTLLDGITVALIVSTAFQDKLIKSTNCWAHRLKLPSSHGLASLDTVDYQVSTIESREDTKLRKMEVCQRTVIPPTLTLQSKYKLRNPNITRSQSTGSRAEKSIYAGTDSLQWSRTAIYDNDMKLQ